MGQVDELFAAIQANDAGRVRELVAADRSLASARNEKQVSAVLWARYGNRLKALGALLEAGPELDIFEAAATGARERAAELVRRDPALALSFSRDGGTALHLAAYFRHPEIAEMLIRAGADVNAVAPGFNNVQPLHSAASSRDLATVKMLLTAGADPNGRQHMNYVPLHSAALSGDLAIARVLLEAGADVTAKSDDGKNSLDLAQDKGHAEVAELLRGWNKTAQAPR